MMCILSKNASVGQRGINVGKYLVYCITSTYIFIASQPCTGGLLTVFFNEAMGIRQLRHHRRRRVRTECVQEQFIQSKSRQSNAMARPSASAFVQIGSILFLACCISNHWHCREIGPRFCNLHTTGCTRTGYYDYRRISI